MSSDLEIFNMALGHLGEKPVSALDPNLISEAGRKLLVFRNMARDMVLKSRDWLEARQPVNLTPLSVAGYNPYAYIYGLPQDFERMSGAITTSGKWYAGTFLPDGDAPARQRVIYAEQAITEAHIIVCLPWDQLSAGLALLVSLRMADLGCVSVTGERRLKDGLKEDIQELMLSLMTEEPFNGDDDTDMGGGLQDWRRLAL